MVGVIQISTRIYVNAFTTLLKNFRDLIMSRLWLKIILLKIGEFKNTT